MAHAYIQKWWTRNDCTNICNSFFFETKSYNLINNTYAILVEDMNHNHQQMKVPPFWNPSSFHPDIHTYLVNYGERLMTVEEASRIGSCVISKVQTVWGREEEEEVKVERNKEMWVIPRTKIIFWRRRISMSLFIGPLIDDLYVVCTRLDDNHF